MSKFLKHLWRAQEPTTGAIPSAHSPVHQLLEKIKGENNVSGDSEGGILSQCRTIRLKRSSESLLSLNGSQVSAAEGYRYARTRLMRLQAERGVRSVVVSSASRHDGKTLTVANLGLSYVQLPETRILLVDADLRRTGLSQLLGLPASPGLVDILSGRANYEKAIVATEVRNLYAVAAGSALISPPELFEGTRWKEFIRWAGEYFKIILVDSPPILPLADFDLIAAGCDGVLVLVRAGSTQRDLLKKAGSLIDSNKCLGLVVNDIQKGAADAGYRYAEAGRAKEES